MGGDRTERVSFMALPLVVGITGASGVVYGVELLKALKRLSQPSHLIISEMGVRTLAIESDVSLDEVRALGFDERAIRAVAPLHEDIVRAEFLDAPAAQERDLIGSTDRREPMRDQEDRPPAPPMTAGSPSRRARSRRRGSPSVRRARGSACP